MLEHTGPIEREAGRSLGFGTGAEALEPPPLESGDGQWPGFGLRWSVDLHRLIVAAPHWCEGYHPSQSVVTAPGRRHRPRSSSPPPVVVTAPVVVTDTICNPGASAAAPEFPPSTRPLADLVTIYHYIYRLVLLTSQPERAFRQSHSTSQDSCRWYLPPVYLNPLARLSALSQEFDSLPAVDPEVGFNLHLADVKSFQIVVIAILAFQSNFKIKSSAKNVPPSNSKATVTCTRLVPNMTKTV